MAFDTKMTDIYEFIARAESECFQSPWSLESVESLLSREDAVCRVSGDNGDMYGYALGSVICGEAELYRIAVLPKFRRRGMGQRLLSDFIADCREKGAEKIFLEVRSKNLPAIALYEKNGFLLINTRKNYYPDDDALIYCLSI